MLLHQPISLPFQVSVLADDILKNVEFDALRIVFNRFHSVVQFVPTISTILSPEVFFFFIRQHLFLYFSVLIYFSLDIISIPVTNQVVEKESEAGGKVGDLDSYEIEGGETKGEILQNLAEFQFSCVRFFHISFKHAFTFPHLNFFRALTCSRWKLLLQFLRFTHSTSFVIHGGRSSSDHMKQLWVSKFSYRIQIESLSRFNL